MENPLLIIDCNYLCHRARFTTGPLSYKGEPTGVVFGFLNQILIISKEVMPSNIIFTWDSRKSKRRRIFPEYKGNRKNEEPDQELINAFKQFHSLRKAILPGLGFSNNWMRVGYEADDLIADVVFKVHGSQYPIPVVIASSDNDLLQLLVGSTRIYNLGRKEYYSREKLKEDYGIAPEEWVEVKKIAGCSGDNVPGVPGVGEKTAIKYLKGELRPELKAYKNIQENKGIIDRNEMLVNLPFPGTQTPTIEDNAFNITAFKNICREHGFNKMMNNLDDWKILFE